ncbi:hypothetical protein JB92DRAFT_2733616 [Gautieria morchelliformis]|nr:hypothetical protein JB92DRAFT_2733616 [Gautieria morchelliformis]
MSRLPPDITRAVTHVKVQVTIDAPLEAVWNAILDFPAYPAWNPFVRSQAITDSNFRPLLAHPKPSEGAHIIMHVRIPPKGLDDNDKGLRSAKDVITFIDEKNRRVVWEAAGFPKWLFRAERWQEVTGVQVDGRTVTKYMTVEVFHGPAAWIIRWFMRKNLVISFEAMANGLKKYTEGGSASP